jgi:hypothetical protein
VYEASVTPSPLRALTGARVCAAEWAGQPPHGWAARRGGGHRAGAVERCAAAAAARFSHEKASEDPPQRESPRVSTLCRAVLISTRHLTMCVTGIPRTKVRVGSNNSLKELYVHCAEDDYQMLRHTQPDLLHERPWCVSLLPGFTVWWCEAAHKTYDVGLCG